MKHEPTEADSIEQLERVRALCLSLPGAVEKIAWGAPTFRAPDKQFAAFADRHHHSPHISLWCIAPQGAQQVLVHAQPDVYWVPPYVGVRGWVAMNLLRIGDEELRERVVEAYRMVAKKRLLAELDAREAHASGAGDAPPSSASSPRRRKA